MFNDTLGSDSKKGKNPSFLLEATFAFDPKVVRLRRSASSEEEGWALCALYLATVGYLRTNGLILSTSELSDVAYSLHIEEAKYLSIVDKLVACELLKRDGDSIFCEALNRRISAYEKKCEILRGNAKSRWEKNNKINKKEQMHSKSKANAMQSKYNIIKYNIDKDHSLDKDRIVDNDRSKIILPDSLNTSEVRSTLKEWYLDRKERKKKPTDRAIQLVLKRYEKRGAASLILALRYSIEQGYTGVFDPPASSEQTKQSKEDLSIESFLQEDQDD